jgi:hypothetical protein
MLIETLDALSHLTTRISVLVIDNNTRDEAVWRPVEAHCAAWPRFRFFHVSPLAGFRPARCFALAQTAWDRDHRRDRQRLSAEPGWPVTWARLPRSEHGDRAGAAGLPRRARECLQGDVLRGVPRFFHNGHDRATAHAIISTAR